jgi:glycosyltransferase involved in cell wall biosynthesis
MQNYPKYLRMSLKLLEKFLSKRTHYVVAVSPYEARIAKEISGRLCEVILEPNIASTSIGEIPNSPQSNCGQLVIRAVGRYCAQKNPKMMTSILNELSSQNVKHNFLWIGSPDDATTAVDLPISGWVAQEQVESHLRSADILLHTATWEAGVPLVALDAIRLGTPALLLWLPEYSGIISQGLFRSETEAAELIRNLAEYPDKVRELCELQRNELDCYLSMSSTGKLQNLYSNGVSH